MSTLSRAGKTTEKLTSLLQQPHHNAISLSLVAGPLAISNGGIRASHDDCIFQADGQPRQRALQVDLSINKSLLSLDEQNLGQTVGLLVCAKGGLGVGAHYGGGLCSAILHILDQVGDGTVEDFAVGGGEGRVVG
jgi:hypothetical protein